MIMKLKFKVFLSSASPRKERFFLFMETIENCPFCGSKEIEYLIVDVHKKATCKDCGKFIKFVAQQPPALYFGKYANTPISELTDKNYIQWLLEKSNIKLSARNIQALFIRYKELQ